MPQPRSGLKIILLILAGFAVLGVLAVVILVVLIRGVSGSMSQFMGPVTFKSVSDEFQVSVIEMKSGANSLSEHVVVLCTNDVKVGIEVVDLSKVSASEGSTSKGGKYFRIEHPYKAGQSDIVHLQGKQATCDISFVVATDPDKTTWTSQLEIGQTNGYSSEKSGGKSSTTLNEKLVVGNIQTNWPDSFRRSSWVPLADLGPYKIVITLE